MRRGRAKPKTTSTTVSIDVQSLALGAQNVNAFSGWDSPATTVLSRTAYGVTAKYLTVADHTVPAATTVGTSRDQEITFWANIGVVYLRWVNGSRAVRFYVNIEAQTYDLSIVDGLTSGLASGAPSGIGVGLTTSLITYTLPAITSLPGYSNQQTAGQTWTAGCEGFEIYLKFNGVEFFRTSQFYVLTPGKIGLGVHPDDSSFGFRSVSVTHWTNIALRSDLTTKFYDLRDLGLKPSISTTGSMTAGSSTLTVASASGFVVGDQICVATGGESGGGVPGERGVGGQWPSLIYATTAARDSDTTQVTDKVCGVLADGNTYQWTGSAWVSYAGNLTRYLSKIVPKALVTTITAISGNILTLATAATIDTTNANVYFNNAALWDAKIDPQVSGLRYQPNCTIYHAAGTWVFAGRPALFYGLVNGITLLGEGKTTTIILSPTGVRETGLVVSQCANPRIANFGMTGNTRADKGYMFAFNATTDQYAGSTSLVVAGQCTSPLIENIRAVNYSNAASEISVSTNGVQRFIDVIHETGHRQYFQWAVNITDSNNCMSEDITFDGPYLFKGLESFRSNGSILRRATGRNVCLSSNSNKDLLLQDCSIYYDANCADSPYVVGIAPVSQNPSAGEPLINLNSNIDNTSGSTTGTGLVVKNCDFDVRGRIWSGVGFWLIGVSGTVDNVIVSGKYPTKPVTSPSGRVTLPNLGSDLVRFFRSDAPNKTITIDGVRVDGAYTQTPVGTSVGGPLVGTIVRNSVMDNLASGGTQTNNITNAAYDALP